MVQKMEKVIMVVEICNFQGEPCSSYTHLRAKYLQAYIKFKELGFPSNQFPSWLSFFHILEMVVLLLSYLSQKT